MDVLNQQVRLAVGTKNLGRVKNKTWTWGQLVDRLSKPTITAETFAQYLKLGQEEQLAKKNVDGYWIGAHCDDGRRARDSIHERDTIALDIDAAPADLLDRIEFGLTGISDLEFVVHSTRKHTAEKPRLRVVVLLKEPVTAEEYPAASRLLAHMLDPTMELVDDVSFRIAQMMYWPSRSSDSDWFLHHNPGEPLDAKQLLADFGDWQDFTKLPYAESRGQKRASAKKAEHPHEKKGIIGAFCRAYSIEDAIAEFLADIYEPDERATGKPRYTYTRGSGFSGAVVEDDGLFLYSHHGTDPCADRLVNAFDMTRIHLFGDRDVEASKEDKPTSLPSYKAMVEMAQKDPRVIAEYTDLTRVFDDADFTDEDVSIGNEAAPAEKKTLDPLDRMNRKHAVAMIAGRTLVITEQKGGRVDFSNVTDLNNFYANVRMPNGNSDEPISAWWMRQPKRRTYAGGIVFSPGKQVPKDTFNLWTGFAGEPDPNASCELFLRHVREVVCSGREDEYQYVMGWLAHIIQRPEEKPGVALILIGEKGVGKDTVGDYVGKLFPKHHTKLSNMEQLVGKFNAHTEKTLLLHVEEGIWAGDKSAHGPLQSLITSSMVMIERKGIDAIQMPSVLRLLISSNEKWVVPATADERRYAVFNVSSCHRRDHAYFDAVYNERDSGGLGALLHTLQSWDISRFNVRDVPETEGLTQQKLEGLKAVPAFWFETLMSGELPAEAGFADDAGVWAERGATVVVDTLYQAYCDWYKDRRGQGHGKLLGKIGFGREVSGLCPRRRNTKIGAKEERRTAYALPPLDECRMEFATRFGAIEWPDDDDIEDML